MMFLMAIYVYDTFLALRSDISKSQARGIYDLQRVVLFTLLLNGHLVLYLVRDDVKYLVFMGLQFLLLGLIMGLYRFFYPTANQAILNNMCLLLGLGFFVIERLSYDKAVRQFIFACVGIFLTCLVPLIVSGLKGMERYSYIYAIVGILGLLLVLLVGSTTNGAKINISLGSIAIQPSEFIKITFVLFAAGYLHKDTSFVHVVKISAIAALHVLILVASKDLGGALLFLVTYLVILYVASSNVLYMLAGLVAGAIASVASYFLFSHVQTRVIAWLDPLSVIDDQGYQISQSLFAIGSGGWLGSGIGQGSPLKIPVVTTDFIFSAISEELGAFFALCLIFVYICLMLMLFNISMQIKDRFYKLSALGLGTMFAMQSLLALGGATKFIPSTGVTLPLVSYGGSSLLSTIIIFALIQGLYVKRGEEGRARPKEVRHGNSK